MVVKVQRPNIEALVETDLSALKVVSGWVELYKPIRRRVNVPALVREFSSTLYEEIDYINEGQNVETFRENFFGVTGCDCARSALESHHAPGIDSAGCARDQNHRLCCHGCCRNRPG